MKVSFYTLGCKVNQYETDVMRSAFEAKGYETACDDENADIFIINSCTVTSVADKKSRQRLRHFKRNNLDSIVVLTGCYSQVYFDEAERILYQQIACVYNLDYEGAKQYVLSKLK